MLATVPMLGGCGDTTQDSPVIVSVVGVRADLTDPVRRLPSPGSKAVLEASAQGLVAFDAAGDIVPALAQRWIVEDGGLSYIFRLRPAKWPDGAPVRADTVAALLDHRIKSYDRPDLKGDLDAVAEIVAMTGEVVEVRLAAPRPNFLQILAQPQMAITHADGGAGPYRREWRAGAMHLTPVPDPLAEADDGAEATQAAILPRDRRVLRAERAAMAILRFREGAAQLVLGGRFQDLPLLNIAGLDRDVVRLDPAPGLFGLAIVGDDPMLADQGVRQALSMAIARERLPGAFSVARWVTTAGIFPGQLDLAGQPLQPGWAALPIAERQAMAARAIAGWRATGNAVPTLRIAMPAGPGARLLYALVTADLRIVGLNTRLVGWDDPADLRLIDEVAPYDSALWYLSRIDCGRAMLCSAEARDALAAAAAAPTAAEKQLHLAEAERIALDYANYIPLGQPIRWSLVARTLDGFQPSPRARHPLNTLFRAPN